MSDKPEVTSSFAAAPASFIRDIVVEDLRSGRYDGRVATRFPPEPNGYLHIGHAKAICIDFGMAQEFGGTCNLRFDDTNPTTEDLEYVESIQEDIRWLGFDWGDRLYYASDYFEQLYAIAVRLIEKGKAYVDSLSEEEIREHRGNYYRKGVESPYRDRPVAENLDLFRRMRAGEFPDGAHVLRAKIDLWSQNMNLRDPVLYRIRHASHHRTGDQWCIYPLYDYAHPLSDAIEHITHSICTLEFEGHRPLYDWFIREAEVFPSQQMEFARLNLTYTIMSKRKLLMLVQQGLVSGWDDPRMPTLAGLRRRGYPPAAIRAFCERVGVAKNDSIVDVGLLEYCVREELNRGAPRAIGVLRPLRLVIENFPEERVEWLQAPNHPEDPAAGTRQLPLSRVVWVERDDFLEDPPRQWFRLAPGREVRLRYACLVRCREVVKDAASGEVVELRCTWDPESLGGTSPDGRVVRGTLHWVSAAHAIPAEARLYDRLFSRPNPADVAEGESFLDSFNRESLLTLTSCQLEPGLAGAAAGSRFQLERLGYFCIDPDSAPGRLVLNRTVTLRDTWAKIAAKLGPGPSREAETAAATAPSVADSAAPPAGAAAGATTPTALAPTADPTAHPPTPPTAGPATAPAGRPGLHPLAPEITIEDFGRLDLRVGLVCSAETVAGAKKLLRLEVDLGEGRRRQIFAGIRHSYPDPARLVGMRVVVLANLKPRQMKWGLSEGMVLAGGAEAHGHFVATLDSSGEGPSPGDRVT